MNPTLKTTFQLTLSLAVAWLFLAVAVGSLQAGGPPDVTINNASIPNERVNGRFLLEIWLNGRWQEIGQPGFNEFPAGRQLSLSNLPAAKTVLIRLTHPGHTAAHLDTILLNGRSPLYVRGQAEPEDLALQKLVASNNDVIDVAGRSLVFEFSNPRPEGQPTLALVARIEAERLNEYPFQYPLSNLYQTMSSQADFYRYTWDSNPGRLTLDGDLNAENLGTPFFTEFSQTGSGHPSDYIYGWVRNSANTLYVALDFTPDNTLDGDKDYAKVYVNTPTGLKMFKVSVPEQTWGRPGFTYTPRVNYQHKIYEFALPLSALELTGLKPGAPLELAFAAYGTAAPPALEYTGTLDSAFGAAGVVTGALISANDHELTDLTLQPNGKIVAVGRAGAADGYDDFAVLRYNADGTPDTGFGAGGVITTDFGTTQDQAQAVALQSDGKIVVVGRSDNYPAMVRYTAGGGLDGDFGTGGIVIPALNAEFYDVTLQNDGKIVVAGSNDFMVARYETSGTLDSAFGATGLITTPLGDFGNAYGVALQTDGKIVAAGSTRTNADTDFALVRYEISGTLDSGFGTGGVVTTNLGTQDDIAYDVALQSTGKIVVVGATGSYDFTLVRYNTDGSLDTGFGTGGVVTTDWGDYDTAYGLTIQADDKIVVVGEAFGQRLGLARYNADGTLDTTFGDGGLADNLLSEAYEVGYAVIVQPADGKIVAAGSANNQTEFLLARYLSGSAGETCFATINGSTVYSSTDAGAVQSAINAANPGDTIKIAGTCAGVQPTGGLTQTAYISPNLTLQGGYTATNWLAAPDPETYPTTLDALNNGRVIYIPAGITATLDSLTLQNGTITGANAYGGGIYAGGSLTLTNSLLQHNYAEDGGGGLYAADTGGGAFINNTHIYSNTGWSGDGGGGLYAAQPITVTNSLINRNVTRDYGGGAAFADNPVFIYNSDIISNTNTEYEGGGLWFSNSQVTIQAGRVLSNAALLRPGGGIYDVGASSLTVMESEIGYNQTGEAGGGIMMYDGGTLSLRNSLVHHNSASSEGGGIYGDGSAITITRSTIAYNTAATQGGGLYLNRLEAGLLNSTLSHNQAATGGGLYGQAYHLGTFPDSVLITLTHASLVSNTGLITGGGLYLEDVADGNAYIAQATMQNSLIAGNSGGDCATTNGWEVLDASPGYNLDSDGSCVIAGVDNNLTSASPGLDALADNGGQTETHALLDDSPALDAIPAGGSCPLVSTDQRGVTRPQGDACDIGAVEMDVSGVYLPIIVKNN